MKKSKDKKNRNNGSEDNPVEKCPHKFYLKFTKREAGTGYWTLCYECELCGYKSWQ